MGFFFDIATKFTHGRNLDTSDEALDSAADFQRGFQEYLPLYNDYTGSSLSLQIDIQRPYDELREIDFRRLSEVAERGAAIADEFQETREEINSRVAEVTGWSGDASNAFLAHIQRFQTEAQTIDGELGGIATVTGEAVPAAQAVIAEYIGTIGEIDFSGFDSPELVRILITIERMAMSASELVDRLYDGIGDLIGMALPVFSSGGGGLFGSIPVVGQVVDAATDFVGDFIGGVLDFFGGADELLALASRLARSYLDASFKQPFEDNLELLNSAVETATQGISEVFQPVMDAAGAVTLGGFTALGEAPAAGPVEQPSSPAAGAPAPVGPSQPTGGAEPVGSAAPAAMPAMSGTGGMPEPAGSPSISGTATMPETTTTAGSGVPGPATAPSMEPVSQPEPIPRPEPLPVADAGEVGGVGDDPGGRPDDLPQGAGWIADPSQLPAGWTVDPETGELLPPGAPNGAGDPEVHSPQGMAVLDGPGLGEVATPPVAGEAAGTASEVSMRLGDRTITFSGFDEPGGALGFTLAGDDGGSARYEIRLDEHGNPQLGPATTIPAADGFGSGTVAGGAEPSFAGGSVPNSVFGTVSGEVSTDGPAYAAASESGRMASGSVSFESGPADGSADGSARLASASMASDSGTASAPGGAQLASAAEEGRAAPQPQSGTGGAPFMPMGGAGGGGGDQERHGGGVWQVPGTDVFEAEDEPVIARGVLGEDR